MEIPRRVRIGTRGSQLALRQTAIVAELLRAAWAEIDITVQIITTLGDQVTDVPLKQMGGIGVFTSNLERALREGAIDLAVHSVKDLPTEILPGAVLGAILERANAADVLVSRNHSTLATLPDGAKVGTSSHRRAAQLRHHRADLQPIDIRGNVDTRIAKALAVDGSYDAIVLAHAGIARLERLDTVSEIVSLDVMLPAPGQAALGVQCRDEARWLALLQRINHVETQVSVVAERAFLSGLGGGCSLPVAAYAYVQEDALYLAGRVIAADGSEQIELKRSYPASLTVTLAQRAGADLAQAVREQGAEKLLEQFS